MNYRHHYVNVVLTAAFVTSLTLVSIASQAQNASVLMGSPKIEVTSAEVLLYLENYGLETGRQPEEMSGQIVAQAILDLYGLKVLDAEASSELGYSSDLTSWLPQYLFMTHRVRQYIELLISRAMAETDWDAEAQDYYRAKPSEFVEGESVTIRTLLLRTQDRSAQEAEALALNIIDRAEAGDAFVALVERYSDDKVGKASGGLMEGVRRGQTVEPFEQAAFALKTPGQFSPPVLSEFGVHLIQLLEKQPAKQLRFEDVSQALIAYLKPVREAEYRAAFKTEPRSREPEGFFYNQEAIDQFMTGLGHEKEEVPSTEFQN